MSKLLIGLHAPSGTFGVIPDPPEPPSDKWYEEHCFKCKYYREYDENGKLYADCVKHSCEFEEMEDDTNDN